MQHTLFAVFDNRTDAQSAMDELLLSGFSQQDVRLSEDTTDVGDTAVADQAGEEGIGASIKHFFSDLFGSNDDVYSQKYSTAVSKGHYVVTVTARDEPEVERAADIVERFGPVDIDEKAATWGGATPSTESTRMSGAGRMPQSEATTLHFQGDRNLFAQQSLNDERPMGQTYQESMGPGEELSTGRFGNTQGESLTGSLRRDSGLSDTSAMGTSGSTGAGSGAAGLGAGRREVQRGGVRVFSPVSPNQSDMDDDSYYRSHWDSTYSATGKDYDDYTPAYSYGHEMANMYRGQPWNDVERDVRKEWESRNATAGESTWEQFKDAIRHGWNRLTH